MIMRKILLFAVVVSVVMFSVPYCFASSRFGAVTVLGDSIASGNGLPDYMGGNNYSAPLSWGNLLGEECSSYENFAQDGMTSEELLLALQAPSDAVERSLENADCVVISIGGNDYLAEIMNAIKLSALPDTDMITALLSGGFRVEMIGEISNKILTSVVDTIRNSDVEGTVSNIREITQEISRINPDAQIVLLTLYNPFAEHILLSEISAVAEEVLAELNSGIKDIADNYQNVRVADVHSAFTDSSVIFTNINRLDIHPNMAGHGKIYNCLCETLGG